MAKYFRKLSLRAMTALGVFSFEAYCEKRDVHDKNIILFNEQLLKLLNAVNLPDWDSDCNQLAISGLGDPLPLSITDSYPKLSDEIFNITENLREITASQIYGGYSDKEATQFLNKVLLLCEFDVENFSDLQLFEEHRFDSDGWGVPVHQS